MMRPAAVRLGLIGVGRWGKVYIRTVLSLGARCRLTQLGTSKPAHAALVPYPVQVTSDWRKAIDSDCDAVLIATPPSTHAQIVEACLEAGKPCMVEKPLCLDLASAERVHQRIQASGVPVLVNHTQLFNPGYQALKRAVDDAGETIRVLIAEGMALGVFRTHTPTLWDWCPHDFNLCLDLMGQSPVRVAALGGPADPNGAPELVSVRLDFAGGSCAWIHAGRLSPHKRRTLSVFTDTQLFMFDDLATERLTVSRMDFARRYANGIPEPLEKRALALASTRRPMEHALTYFLDGLAGGDRRYFGSDLALEVVRLLEQCESAMKKEEEAVSKR